jgi:hypothetical protein
LPAHALERSLHILKHRGPGLLWRWCDRLPAAVTELEAVQKQLHSFRKREALMQYPQYQEQGWPLGSGMVESANKVVVHARLKGAGMHWEPPHVNPMLALRTAVCSERWDEAWQDSSKEQHAQVSAKRQHVAATRLQSQLACLLLLLLRFRPPSPKPAPPSPTLAQPAATLPGSSRPSAHHPWKRVPACRPKLTAKNDAHPKHLECLLFAHYISYTAFVFSPSPHENATACTLQMIERIAGYKARRTGAPAH